MSDELHISIMRIKMKYIITILSIGLFLAALYFALFTVPTFVRAHYSTDSLVQCTRKLRSDTGLDMISSGTRIVGALDAYREQTGQYPDQLEALLPDYLSDIPECKIGNAWHYGTRMNGREYMLGFGCGNDAYPGYVFDSATGDWEADY